MAVSRRRLPLASACRAASDRRLGRPIDERHDSAPPQAPVVQAEGAPHWTFSAEAIGLARQGGANQTLVARVPGGVPYYAPPGVDSSTYPGVEALNSDQFWQRLAAGPKLGLTYHSHSGLGMELSYFSVLGLSATKSTGPDNPADWLVMKAPGTFWQTQDFPYQTMGWKDATSLYSVEANARLEVSPRWTVLAGLRWLQLNDRLEGTLTPADHTAPTWKTTCPGADLLALCTGVPGRSGGRLPAFLDDEHEEQPLWRPDRLGRKAVGAWPLVARRPDQDRTL